MNNILNIKMFNSIPVEWNIPAVYQADIVRYLSETKLNDCKTVCHQQTLLLQAHMDFLYTQYMQVADLYEQQLTLKERLLDRLHHSSASSQPVAPSSSAGDDPLSLSSSLSFSGENASEPQAHMDFLYTQYMQVTGLYEQLLTLKERLLT
jgi:hypothetical protein